MLIWQRRRDGLLRVADYRDLGEAPDGRRPGRNGLQVALGRRADTALEELLGHPPLISASGGACWCGASSYACFEFAPEVDADPSRPAGERTALGR